MNIWMLLSVRWISESSVTSSIFTFEWLFTWKNVSKSGLYKSYVYGVHSKSQENYLCEFSYEFSNFRCVQSSFRNLDMDKWMAFLQCELWCDWQACIWLWKRYDFWNIRPSSKCDWYFLNFSLNFLKNNRFVDFQILSDIKKFLPGPPTWSMVIWWTTSLIKLKCLLQCWPFGMIHLHVVSH